MEILTDPEEMMICPYNNSHHIRAKRMNTHLVKCKKSYPETKLVECDFNVNHKIPEPERQYHHSICPDRQKIEISIYQEAGSDINKFPVHNLHVPTDESWDDVNVPTYDPQKYCESKDILRHIDVESAAKRRDFRVAERKRLGQYTNIQVQQAKENEVIDRNVPGPSRRNCRWIYYQ
ncbi:hypothetical protein JTB14_032848 [Gonioctena quinquepunctata]|nr:hypothetical protein JTB14_032848 [Gonioctena quinquepunctata]